MHTRMVAVRCFAEHTAGGWEAHCVDLGLTVRGESLESVKSELDHLIHEHIDDTLVLRRPTPRSRSPRDVLALRLRYWGLYLAGRLGLRTDVLRLAEQRRSRAHAARVPVRAAR